MPFKALRLMFNLLFLFNGRLGCFSRSVIDLEGVRLRYETESYPLIYSARFSPLNCFLWVCAVVMADRNLPTNIIHSTSIKGLHLDTGIFPFYRGNVNTNV